MTNQIQTDEMYMRRCLQLARCGEFFAKPNPMVGAVIVARGRIIGEGFHERYGNAHAEVNAFVSVFAGDEHLLREATVYVNLEPCSHWGKTPPCAALMADKGVRRVVVGCIDPFAEVCGRGIKQLRDAGIDVEVGVLEDECRHLNRRFFTFHSLRRPYITLKWAQTANGFMDNDGMPFAISTPVTLMLMHKVRSENDAIVVGRITEEREHPQLSVRHWVGASPVKMVLTHNVGSFGGIESGLTDKQVLDTLMKAAHDSGVQSMLVEGGGNTLQSFIDNMLYDKIRVETSRQCVLRGTRAPKLPSDATPENVRHIDGNTITLYRRQGSL
ncbi:bifunctional diaminohydroxyphosphoribosylaminopyrimidine deaminase/5-amino-6-(5-phosphoribosylamino)uracil reductase RibD [Prevotella sp. OH937_COT-195]|uniref:bifunctional diaminohydroxyphosphoribosylaminopyrimidine deaminase/5-amino-6-(5-phosphoribosylamino)uracil reductase RibD n=1 Tax=Prevotella sp. OH937_COT-195 TaxID=2491051 RepID=UPI000F64A5D5|nr:bifunctional diaminohydroxyphosphoribosylaminopyrimidine deaminase/5-amino-6-(5-phosphoribosylamino)uracil reductase RibD [Prevotella sp. OH937_COT-195]RRC98433.1 bifunctional diaminohydroxyphosphoribosylaminopyrimidine deaminase/5-amino-6-(5-phosphoribosylamino)uracil reductase RibD [Prevotella sp. OH937_COT-195]